MSVRSDTSLNVVSAVNLYFIFYFCWLISAENGPVSVCYKPLI